MISFDKTEAKENWVKVFLISFRRPYVAWGIVGGYIVANVGIYLHWPNPITYLLNSL